MFGRIRLKIERENKKRLLRSAALVAK